MATQIETPDFRNMEIAKLREYAKHMRLAIARTAKKEEIVEAIERKLTGRIMPELSGSGSTLKPGYDRIKVLSDPMPQASNLPVYLNANGYLCLIPRDVEVIVPHRVVRVLNDAVVKRHKQTSVMDQNGRESFKDTQVTQPSYPFQLLESNPGPEVLTSLEMTKLRTAGPKRRYREMFGRWPRPRELTRALEKGLIKLDEEEMLDAATEEAMAESAAAELS